jgi:uncharacterized membrane protein YhaH (DUF805 family)
MTPPGAVKSCLTKFVDFKGCASRSEFWWWTLIVAVTATLLRYTSCSLFGAIWLATFLPSAAVTARRLHETDRSGWLQLLWFIPLIGWILVIAWCAEPRRPNRYDVSL